MNKIYSDNKEVSFYDIRKQRYAFDALYTPRRKHVNQEGAKMDFIPNVWYFGGAHQPPLNIKLLIAIDWGKIGFHYVIREYDDEEDIFEYDEEEDIFICMDKWWFKIIDEPNDPLRTYVPVIVEESHDDEYNIFHGM